MLSLPVSDSFFALLRLTITSHIINNSQVSTSLLLHLLLLHSSCIHTRRHALALTLLNGTSQHGSLHATSHGRGSSANEARWAHHGHARETRRWWHAIEEAWWWWAGRRTHIHVHEAWGRWHALQSLWESGEGDNTLWKHARDLRDMSVHLC